MTRPYFNPGNSSYNKLTSVCYASVLLLMINVDEYDTDTDTDDGFSELSEVPVNRACTTRSGRVIQAYLWVDI